MNRKLDQSILLLIIITIIINEKTKTVFLNYIILIKIIKTSAGVNSFIAL